MLISEAFAQNPTADTTASVEAAPPSDMPNAPYELSQEKMFKDTMVFLFLLFIVFYFVLIRPQQKKFKAHQAILNDLKKGDEVLAGGGLIGRIHKFEDDNVAIVEIADNVRVRMPRNSISGRYFAANTQITPPSKPAKASKSANTANDN